MHHPGRGQHMCLELVVVLADTDGSRQVICGNLSVYSFFFAVHDDDSFTVS